MTATSPQPPAKSCSCTRSDDENFIRHDTHASVTEDLKHDLLISKEWSINYLPKNGIRAPKTNRPAREQRVVANLQGIREELPLGNWLSMINKWAGGAHDMVTTTLTTALWPHQWRITWCVKDQTKMTPSPGGVCGMSSKVLFISIVCLVKFSSAAYYLVCLVWCKNIWLLQKY